jgi:hypothetical protein
MRRTPLWVFVAAVGVQLAALGLCLWVMDHARRSETDEDEAPASPDPARAQAEALPPAPPLTAMDLLLARNAAGRAAQREPEAVPAREAAPLPAPEPVQAFEPEPAVRPEPELVRPAAPPQSDGIRRRETPPAPEPPLTVEAPYVHEQPRPRADSPEPRPVPAPRRVVIRAVQPASSGAPLFGPPPDRPPEPPRDPNAIPRYITELADATTQVVRGKAAEGQFTFGFYPDGNIRFVDADGGRYAGQAESARARMREDGGTRAFTVQIGVAPDGRLQATFTGGPHDAQTVPLEPLAGWSAV